MADEDPSNGKDQFVECLANLVINVIEKKEGDSREYRNKEFCSIQNLIYSLDPDKCKIEISSHSKSYSSSKIHNFNKNPINLCYVIFNKN